MNRRTCLITGAGALGALVYRGAPAVAAAAAPEFTGLEGWLNTGTAPSMAGLRGKAVLVTFWTYTCINARRTLPYLRRWHAEYGARGLEVIGIHTPEFAFEHAAADVAFETRALGIRYSVAQDNEFATWRAFSNRAWPTFHLVDRQGRVVMVREGEGHAVALEAAIRGLLGLTPDGSRPQGEEADLSHILTPEIYFGGLHPSPQDRAQSPRPGVASYAFAQAPAPRLNGYALDGAWERGMEPLTLRSARGGMRMRFSAAKVHLVASAPSPTRVLVSIDGGEARAIEIGRPTLYTLFDAHTAGEYTLSLQADAPGLTLFSATFG